MNSNLLRLSALFFLWFALTPAGFAEPLPVQTVEFSSEAVGRKMKYNIVLPEKYE